MLILDTPRLSIRQWESPDTNRLIEIANKPNIQKWLLDWDNPQDWIAGWIENMKKHYEIDNPIMKFISWAIVLKENDKIIGQINIGGDAFDNKETEVAYFIDDDFNGHGYATEATKAIVSYVFQTYGYDHINAMVEPLNYASVATVKKVGFVYTKTSEELLSGCPEPAIFDFYELRNPA